MKNFLIVCLIFLCCGNLFYLCTPKPNNPLRVIPLDTKGEKSINVIKKGENSILLHSGFVTLKKGEQIGKHNSKDYEELIIVLKGKGVFVIEGQEPIPFKENEAIYCPPFSEHNIVNNQDEELKYVYVVAKTDIKGEKNAHS